MEGGTKEGWEGERLVFFYFIQLYAVNIFIYKYSSKHVLLYKHTMISIAQTYQTVYKNTQTHLYKHFPAKVIKPFSDIQFLVWKPPQLYLTLISTSNQYPGFWGFIFVCVRVPDMYAFMNGIEYWNYCMWYISE